MKASGNENLPYVGRQNAEEMKVTAMPSIEACRHIAMSLNNCK